MIDQDLEIYFLKYPIFAGKTLDLSRVIDEEVDSKSGLAIHFSAAHGFAETFSNPRLQDIFENELIVCDGKPLSMYLRIRYKRDVQLRGTDFMRFLLSSNNPKLKHFFLGSTEKTLLELSKNARKANSNVNICETFSPPFTENVEEIVELSLAEIRKTNANVIWVGLGAPKQFLVSSELAKSHAALYLSVGAAFDFIAETTKEAPRLVRQLSIEWLFRFLQHPIKLFKRYFLGNATFIFLIIKDIFNH